MVEPVSSLTAAVAKALVATSLRAIGTKAASFTLGPASIRRVSELCGQAITETAQLELIDATPEVLHHVEGLIGEIVTSYAEDGGDIFELNSGTWLTLAKSAKIDTATLPPRTAYFVVVFLCHLTARVYLDAHQKGSPLFGMHRSGSPTVQRMLEPVATTGQVRLGRELAEALQRLTNVHNQTNCRIYSPQLLSAVLESDDGTLRAALDAVSVSLSARLLTVLKSYHSDKSPFKRVDWESHPDVIAASYLAMRMQSLSIHPLHLFLAIFHGRGSTAAQLRMRLGVIRVEVLDRAVLAHAAMREDRTPGFDLGPLR